MNHRLIASLAIVGALGLAACGDDGNDSAATTTPAAATTAASQSDATMATTEMSGSQGGTATTMAAAASSNIVEVADGAGDFKTLVKAIQAAGLAETLSGPGPFTVFAPTDEAFAALPAGALDQLLADPTGKLADILKYHVVAGKVMAADVAAMNGKKVTTVNGATFTVNVNGSAVTLTDAAGNTVNVVKTDIPASNGVIHVIDKVLMPS
jgi:uncharacterized surface protein with fasciclin (FAS1) repeats